ncbi:CPBP family intramembrane glutamic endopeptidase [Corynebacterium nasicanis]|uniref:CPBP family intramembrane glutamic endopeptidase n=1 Tax=Corynebacterium nasicanis TaxID=1448267 RepID=A0ABW1QCJ1_9CORY
MTRQRLWTEILIVLAVSFGISGVRGLLRLTDALYDSRPLNEQQITLHQPLSNAPWIDFGLQLASAGTLFAYGALALYLLAGQFPRPRWSDLGWGAGLAGIIGIPGLAFYATALHLGLTREVIPATTGNIPVLLTWSFANAWGEEIVVVMYLLTRLRQLGWGLPAALAFSSVLRGSYHLYQGVSAGFGNILMGLLYGWFYWKTGRIWPLIIAHFLIDAVAFVGYAAIGGDLSWLGIGY